MTLPNDIREIRNDLGSIYPKEHRSTYDKGFNAGFEAFRDSEMMREIINILEDMDHIIDAVEVLDKYRAWLGSENESLGQ